MAKKLSSLAVGSKVRETSSTYNGLPLDGIILGHDHDGEGITSFMSEKIITLKCFDAAEPGNSEKYRRSNGNNRYKASNILQWLNSEGVAGNWYVAQHGADAPPTNGNVKSNYNEYDQEAGFLTFLSKRIKDELKTVSKTTVKYKLDGSGKEEVSAKIHMLSATEVGFEDTEGKIYEYFSEPNNNERYTVYPTQPCVDKSEYVGSDLATSKEWSYWLRTPGAGFSCNVKGVSQDKKFEADAYNGTNGVRPIWFLSSDILVSDSPNNEGYYEIQWNAEPIISIPSTSLGDKNKAFNVEFTVEDEDGDVCTAAAAIDGTTIQTWNPVTLGAMNMIEVTSARLSALTLGAHTIKITATDSAGNTTTKDVFFNRVVMAPVISTSSTSLGNQNKHFTVKFTVTDDDSNDASAVVKIDGTDTIGTFNPVTLGAEQTVEVTSTKLSSLSLGAHTINIYAQDAEGNEADPVSISFNRIVTAPVIEVKDADVGEQNKLFSVKFKVTDDDSDSASAVIKIDNSVTIATFNPVVLDHWTEVTISNSQIVALSVGAHTIDITAEDPDGNQDTAQITFIRAASTVIISGKDEDMGEIWAKPMITYQVYDTADQTITKIVEKISDETVRTIENPPTNTDIDFDLTSWANLPDEASYICKITVENEIGMTAERTYTFRKLYDRLIVESEIQQTDAVAFNVAVNALYDGGTPVIEACNNAYDDIPTWEDMTEEFLKGSAHAFTNTEKTALQYGVKVRITLLKGDTERVYLNAYGFSFN